MTRLKQEARSEVAKILKTVGFSAVEEGPLLLAYVRGVKRTQLKALAHIELARNVAQDAGTAGDIDRILAQLSAEFARLDR